MRETLWPERKVLGSAMSEEELALEDREFSLTEAIDDGDVTIFPHTPETLKKLFLDGRKLSSEQQLRMMKSFQVKKFFYCILCSKLWKQKFLGLEKRVVCFPGKMESELEVHLSGASL